MNQFEEYFKTSPRLNQGSKTPSVTSSNSSNPFADYFKTSPRLKPQPVVGTTFTPEPITITLEPVKKESFFQKIGNLFKRDTPVHTMEFKVGEGMNDEQTAEAHKIISGKGIIPLGQEIKAPFIQAGITVPDSGGVGTGYSFLKTFIEASERITKSYGQMVGIKPTDENTVMYKVPTYQETAAKTTSDLIDMGYTPAQAVLFATTTTAGEFAGDALLFTGPLERGYISTKMGTKMPSESQVVAWDFLGRPKTFKEAQSAYRNIQKEFHPDISGSDIISKQANNAMEIIKKEGIPTQNKLRQGINDLFNKPIDELFGKKSGLKPSTKPIKQIGVPMTPEAIQAKLEAAKTKTITPVEPTITPEITKVKEIAKRFEVEKPKIDIQQAIPKGISKEEWIKGHTPIFRGSESVIQPNRLREGATSEYTGTAFSRERVQAQKYGDNMLVKYLQEDKILQPKDISPEILKNLRNDFSKLDVTDADSIPTERLITKVMELAKQNNKKAADIASFFPSMKVEAEIRLLGKVTDAPTRSQLSSLYDEAVKEGKATTGKTITIKPEDLKIQIEKLSEQYLKDKKFETKEEAIAAAKKFLKMGKEIKGEYLPRPEQLVSKSDLKDMLSGLKKESVDLEVVEKHGDKYMSYDDGKTSFLLRPSALGLVEENIIVGDTVNISKESLKETGTAFRGVGVEKVTVPGAKELVEKSVVLASGVDIGLDKFIEKDIKPHFKGMVEPITKTWDFIKKQFNPASRGLEAKKTTSIMRESLGRMARRKEMTYKVLENSRKIFDKYSEEESLKFIDNLENGRPNPGAERFTEVMRDALDSRYKTIQEIKGSEAYIENYFPHIWEDPNEAKNVMAAFLGKKPLEGSKSFLKQRKIPTIKEGIELGLKPASYNPVDLIMSKVADMDKFLMANDVWSQFKEEGLRKFVRPGGKAPEGWIQINDKISQSFQFSEAERALILRGRWYMPEQAATIVNNYLSPGLANNPIYQGFRKLGNTLNQVQLGMSAYHVLFTSGDAITSKIALEIQKIFDKGTSITERTIALVKAISAPITSPYLLWKNIVRGNKLLKNYFSKNPVIPEIVDALERAGGRVKMDSFYKNNAVEEFFKAFRSGNKIGALFRAPSALIEGFSKFIMEDLVPRQKLGVFSDMATHILKQAEKGNWSEYETTLRLQEAWDSVDNRMGQLVYDNLFWNKVLKDVGMASVRSLGWNIGDLREIPGGVIGIVKTPYRAFKGNARMDPKMAYVIALPYVMAVFGSIIYYLYNGEAPETLKDMYYPRTGKKKTDGSDERISLPSYMKDVYAYGIEPWQTVKNKLHPELSAITQMLSNQDYFGTEIRNPDDPYIKQLWDLIKYQAKQFVPFSVTNLIQREKVTNPNSTWINYLQSFGGISPAPAYITRTPLQREMYELYDKRFGGGVKTKQEKEEADRKSQVRTLYLIGKTEEANTALKQLIKDGIIKSNGINEFTEQADIPNDIKLFKRFTTEDQIALVRKMNLVELNRFAWYSNKEVKAKFSTISENTKAWVELGKEGKLTSPKWKRGLLVIE